MAESPNRTRPVASAMHGRIRAVGSWASGRLRSARDVLSNSGRRVTSRTPPPSGLHRDMQPAGQRGERVITRTDLTCNVATHSQESGRPWRGHICNEISVVLREVDAVVRFVTEALRSANGIGGTDQEVRTFYELYVGSMRRIEDTLQRVMRVVNTGSSEGQAREAAEIIVVAARQLLVIATSGARYPLTQGVDTRHRLGNAHRRLVGLISGEDAGAARDSQRT